MDDPQIPYALVADQQAVDKATALIGKLAAQLGEAPFYAVLRELYMDGFAYYDELGNFQLGLSPLQTVAVGYALAAFVKGGAEWDGTTAWGGRTLPDDTEFP